MHNEGPPEPAASDSAAPSNVVVPASAPTTGGGPPRLTMWLREPPSWLGSWVPFLATFVSLWFSVSAYVEATRDPELTMVMPDQVRISGTRFPEVFLQPAFLSTGNNRVEVVRNISMRLEPLSGGDPVQLQWVAQGKWEYDASFDSLTYVPGTDAGPMLVSPTTPQVPVAVFRNVEPVEWGVAPGDYRLVLTAVREVVQQPLERTVLFTVTQEQADEIASRSTLYHTFGLRHP
jgi:hypothetical protein